MDVLVTHKEWIDKQWGEISTYFAGPVMARVRAAPTMEKKKFVTTKEDVLTYASTYSLIVALNTLCRGHLLRGQITEAVGDQIVYTRVRGLVTEFLKGWGERLAGTPDDAVLRSVAAMWMEFAMLRDAVACLFRYLDQHYATGGGSPLPLRAMCDNDLKEIFYNPIRGRVHRVIVDAVMAVRGRPMDEVMASKGMLYPAVQLVHTMHDYEVSLEATYLKAIVETCSANAAAWQSTEMASYLRNVETFTDDELRVVEECFGIPSTTAKVLAAIRDLLLAKQRDVVLRDTSCGVGACLADHDALARLYKLYSYDPVSVASIASEFKKHVHAIVKALPDTASVVPALDTHFQTLKEIVVRSCAGSDYILSAVTTGFKEAITFPHFDQHLIAAIDAAVRKPESGALLSVAKLAPFVTSMSKFRTLYTMALVQRHLARLPARQVVEREVSILPDIKAAVGPSHSRNIHAMVSDVARRENTSGVRFLNGAMWPGLAAVEVKYRPLPEVSAAFDKYGKEYAEGSAGGRSLRWSLTYGMSELRMRSSKYPDGIAVTCSNPQMTVLATMQRRTWSLADLLAALDMSDADFRPILSTLVQCALVVKDGAGTMRVDAEWDPKTAKIMLPQPTIIASTTAKSVSVHHDPTANLTT